MSSIVFVEDQVDSIAPVLRLIDRRGTGCASSDLRF